MRKPPFSFATSESFDGRPSESSTQPSGVGSASFAFSTWGFDTKVTIWTGAVGLVVNLVVAAALTPLLGRLPRGRDQTSPADYEEADVVAAPGAI